MVHDGSALTMASLRLGPTCRLLGVLVLLLRLLGPAQPMLDGLGGATLTSLFPGGIPICHAAGTEPADPAQPAKAPTHDCQFCLICHAAGQVPLFPVEAVWVLSPEGSVHSSQRMVPPATDPPPALRRRATPPIGPPAPSV